MKPADTKTAAEYRAIIAGKRSAGPRRLTPAAKAVADATRETFGTPRAVAGRFRANAGHPRIVEITVPIRIRSTPNERVHWAVKHRRNLEHDAAVTYSLAGSRVQLRAIADADSILVTLTRIGVKLLDTDNLAAGFKATRDAIARCLGIDDGDARIAWRYTQEAGGKYAVRIRIEVAHA